MTTAGEVTRHFNNAAGMAMVTVQNVITPNDAHRQSNVATFRQVYSHKFISYIAVIWLHLNHFTIVATVKTATLGRATHIIYSSHPPGAPHTVLAILCYCYLLHCCSIDVHL